MRHHELKTHPDPFAAVWAGVKTYEIRVNDRDYAVGDELRLREWDPVSGCYTGPWIDANVDYLTRGGEWGLPAELCVMSIKIRARGNRLDDRASGEE
jgi:hypothetical protein